MQIDLAKFSQGNVVLPGTYRSDVYLNGQWSGRESLTFSAMEGQDTAQLCLEREALMRVGVDMDAIEQDAAESALSSCADISSYLPGASSRFDAGENRLDLQIPQIYLARKARGYVDPNHWDGGIDAAFVRYNANTFLTQANGRSVSSNYLGLNTGLNLGAWHWRHNGSYSQSTVGSGYQSSSTYVQREVSALQSQLMVGEI